MKSILKQLTQLYGPPGHERYLVDSISKLFRQYCDEVKVDKLFNVIGLKRANPGKEAAFKVMIAAHVDEIGMMVTDIDKKGFIKFAPVGGIDPRILPSQEVVIHSKREVYGVIGAKPPHLISEEEKKKAVSFEDFYIDIGMSEKEAKDIIDIGDTVTFKPYWSELQNELVSSKSLDNRAGVASMIGILEEIKHLKHEVDIICVATSQEEVGLRGALVSAYGINPDAAIVIDGCHGDMPGLDKEETYTLGKGPAIAIGPNIHPELAEHLKQVAKEENIPYQVDVEPGNTGTDAWGIQVSRSGIPTVLISIPLRYMHSTVETISIVDLKNTSRLTAHFFKRLDEKLEGMKCFLRN